MFFVALWLHASADGNGYRQNRCLISFLSNPACFKIQGCVSGIFQSVGIGALKPNTVMVNWPDAARDNYNFAGKRNSVNTVVASHLLGFRKLNGKTLFVFYSSLGFWLKHIED